MATNSKTKRKYKPKPQAQWNGVVRAYRVTGPIEEYINRLLNSGVAVVDIHDHHVFLHKAPSTYQHVGSGLQAIVAYVELANADKKTMLNTQAMRSLIQTLLDKTVLEEDQLKDVLVELEASRRMMALLTIDESTAIIAKMRIHAKEMDEKNNLSFPDEVIF